MLERKSSMPIGFFGPLCYVFECYCFLYVSKTQKWISERWSCEITFLRIKGHSGVVNDDRIVKLAIESLKQGEKHGREILTGGGDWDI